MSTIPFAMPQTRGAAMPGQMGLPGNTSTNTVAPNYSFLPGVQNIGKTGTAFTGNPAFQRAAIPATPGGQPSNPNQVWTQQGVGVAPSAINNPNLFINAINPFATGNLPNLNAQIPGAQSGNIPSTELYNMFGTLGQTYGNWLSSGAGYNPAVLNALIAQMQPQIQAGMANIGSSAGATGTAFGSPYGQAMSDYLGQVNLNELGTAAGLYQQSAQNINQGLQSLLGPAGQWRTNQAGQPQAWLASLLPLLTGAGSPLGGALTSLLNLIPGISIPQGGGGGGLYGGLGTNLGGILGSIGPGGTATTFPGGINTGGTTLPPVGGSTTPAGGSTTGGLPSGGVPVDTGVGVGGGDLAGTMQNLAQLIIQGAGGLAPLGGGGGASTFPGNNPSLDAYQQYLDMVQQSTGVPIGGGGGGWYGGGLMMDTG